MKAPVEIGSTAPPAPPEPRRAWRFGTALLALTVFVIVACTFYFVQNLPDAEAIRPEESWPVHPSEQLRLHGLRNGTVLRLNFSAAAGAKLSFPVGTRLAPDADAIGQPAVGPVEANLFNVDKENGEIVLLISSPGGRGTLIFDPASPDPQSLSLKIRSEESALAVRAFIVANPSVRRHGQIQIGDHTFDDVYFTPPVGAAVTIRLRRDQLDGLRKEVGELQGDIQALEVAVIEIGSVANGKFERRSLACGARKGALFWSHLWSRLAVKHCKPGYLNLVKLELATGATAVNLTGPGFSVRDGNTNVWQGFGKLNENPLVNAFLLVIIGGLIGWVASTMPGRRSPQNGVGGDKTGTGI